MWRSARRLRARFGTLKGVERPVQDGDFVSIDLSADVDGEEVDAVKGVSYEVGSNNMLEGMDEALIGMQADETKTFTAPLAGGDREGQDANCTVTVLSVKERELPELDDEFAQLASEFDTLEELKADLTEKAGTDAKFAQGVAARDKLLEVIWSGSTCRCPRVSSRPRCTRTSRARDGSRTTSTAPRSTRAPQGPRLSSCSTRSRRRRRCRSSRPSSSSSSS